MKNRVWLTAAAASILSAAVMLAGCGRTYEPIVTTQADAQKSASAKAGGAGQVSGGADTSGQADEAAVSQETDSKGTNSRETEDQLPDGQMDGGSRQEQPEQTSGSDTAGADKTEPQLSQEPSDGGRFTFADVKDWEFYFSSGAGGWYTVLHIHADGSFDGHYQDADMGDSGDGYDGTLYLSDFSGMFTRPEKIDDTTYRFRISSMQYEREAGEEIVNGTRCIYSEAYGLDDAEDLYMYLPGSEILQLPQAYRDWVGYHNAPAIEETELSFYGLYNEKPGYGFSSSDYGDAADSAAEAEKNEALLLIENTEAVADSLEEDLQNAATQAEMNEISMQIYTVWDDILNTIWGILREELDDDTMQELTQEERAWIVEKENAAKKAGAEYEGGSMQPLAVNLKAAELTRERCYVLAEYLEER